MLNKISFRSKVIQWFGNIKRGSVISYAITIIFTLGLVGVIASKVNTVTHPREVTGSLNEQFSILRDNYNYYIEEVSKQELLRIWVELYADSTYRLDGNPRYNEYDCASSVINFLNRRFGANVSNENVKALDERIDKLIALDLISVKDRYNAIEIKDIIIFNPLPDGSWHCAIVCEKNKGLIQYMDMNGRIDRMSVRDEEWNSPRIRKIVSISFPLWLGDLLEKYKY